MKTGLILNTIALLLAIAWTVYKPDFEPLIVTITLITTLIGQVAFDTIRKKKIVKMKQKGGDGSTNIQIGEIKGK